MQLLLSHHGCWIVELVRFLRLRSSVVVDCDGFSWLRAICRDRYVPFILLSVAAPLEAAGRWVPRALDGP